MYRDRLAPSPAWPPTGPLVVFDLEFTAWPGSMERGWTGPGEHREVVAIGAVKLAASLGLPEVAHFHRLVKPRINPMLSEYFVALTGLDQARVDATGLSFPGALEQFRAFAGDGVQFFSNGGDEDVLLENCRLEGIAFPFRQGTFSDVRAKLAAACRSTVEEVDSSRLPDLMGFAPEGRAHDALNDARMVAEALRRLVLKRETWDG